MCVDVRYDNEAALLSSDQHTSRGSAVSLLGILFRKGRLLFRHGTTQQADGDAESLAPLCTGTPKELGPGVTLGLPSGFQIDSNVDAAKVTAAPCWLLLSQRHNAEAVAWLVKAREAFRARQGRAHEMLICS